MNAAARLRLLRGGDQQDPTAETAGTPALRMLEALNRWKSEAYNCDAEPGRWHADCPICGEHRTVRIRELAPDGPVVASCATGCSGAEIRRVLTEIAATPAVDRQDTDWRAIALEARDIALRQASLIDDLLARRDAGQEAA